MSHVATLGLEPAAIPAGPTAITPPFTRAYTRYAMGLLLAIYIVNFLDRQVVNILAEPIKNDLGLADWQLGLMSGLAFAVFYTFLGIPIARLAERRHRPIIIGASVAAWSGFTALCGAAQNFTQLVACRIGVGVGEAGCTPPAHSLIVDYVPKEKRASALAFYSMGTPLGGLVGMIMGGLVADAYGWRAAFLVAGVPGILFALLALFTLKEPRRLMARHAAQVAGGHRHFRRDPERSHPQAHLLVHRLRRGHQGVHRLRPRALHRLVLPAEPPRRDRRPRQAGGRRLRLRHGPGGLPGAGARADRRGGRRHRILAGRLARRQVRQVKDLRAYMVAPAIASLLTIPIYITAVTVDSAVLGILMLTANALLGTIWYGPVYGTAQSIVPPHMRATTAAILLFIINLIGLGLGPLAVGLLSDWFNHGLGLGSAQGVRWALIVSTLFGLVAFAFFWIARKTIREDNVS